MFIIIFQGRNQGKNNLSFLPRFVVQLCLVEVNECSKPQIFTFNKKITRFVKN